MQIHSRLFWKLLLLVIVTAIFQIPPSPLKAQETDIQMLKVVLSKSAVKPGETVDLTYWLRSEGPLNAGFNMGIFIARGGNGEWVKKWGLPDTQLDRLRNGGVVSQKWSILIPNWGDGEYRFSICADVENRLGDVNRENNTIEKKIMAGNVAVMPPVISIIKPTLKEGVKKRTFKQDGSVEIRFADGCGKILHPNGRISYIQKDGSITTTYALQVSSGDLPPLPDQVNGWAQYVQDNLLQIIKGQLDNNEMSLYMNSETEKNCYDLVLWRINFIDFILSEK
ncbi:MAG: hypothetical protein J7K32_00790 [Deltaproteobacteria bacterium]|nr:hypothetical protein [Deltaproteobacteria bacterium]